MQIITSIPRRNHDVELLIVVAIIATLAAIAIPSYISSRNKAKIDRVVASTFDPDEIIRATVTRIADCVNCQINGISLIQSNGSGEHRAIYSFQSDRHRISTENVTLRPHERRVLAEYPKYMIIETNDSRPHYLPKNSQLQLPNLLILPVWVKKNLAAILWLAGSQNEQFSTEDITLARQLADQVAVALSNSSLIAELQEMNWGALQALAQLIAKIKDDNDRLLLILEESATGKCKDDQWEARISEALKQAGRCKSHLSELKIPFDVDTEIN